MRILGRDAESIARDADESRSRKGMRFFVAVRARFAEDALAAALNQGVDQLVILGAGLDTYAYRTQHPDRLRIFEVDHPDTQAWKRERLRETGIPVPASLSFAPIDFEDETLGEGLTSAGFDPDRQSFFTWLGVVPYLTGQSVWSTLEYIASLHARAQVVFDYSNPPASLAPDRQADHEVRAQHVARLGEPWLTFFDTDDLHPRLISLGFREIEDLGPGEIASRYLAQSGTPFSRNGGHIVRATNAAR